MEIAKVYETPSQCVSALKRIAFGELLRSVLKQLGISQSSCAKLMTISAMRVNRWARGMELPKRKDCIRLATVLREPKFFDIIPALPRKPAAYKPVKIRGARVYTLSEYAAR